MNNSMINNLSDKELGHYLPTILPPSTPSSLIERLANMAENARDLEILNNNLENLEWEHSSLVEIAQIEIERTLELLSEDRISAAYERLHNFLTKYIGATYISPSL